MTRPAGRRNDDFEIKRTSLVRRTWEAWLTRGPGVSLRDLARLAGVSVTLLRHYFGNRTGLYRAAMEQVARDSEVFLSALARPRGSEAAESLEVYLRGLVEAWRKHGWQQVFGTALAEGLGDPTRGGLTVAHVVEPFLVSGEQLLDELEARGLVFITDRRAAALALLSPTLLVLLHQDNLMGGAERAMDVEAVIRESVRGWLSGFGRYRASVGVSAQIAALRAAREDQATGPSVPTIWDATGAGNTNGHAGVDHTAQAPAIFAQGTAPPSVPAPAGSAASHVGPHAGPHQAAPGPANGATTGNNGHSSV